MGLYQDRICKELHFWFFVYISFLKAFANKTKVITSDSNGCFVPYKKKKKKNMKHSNSVPILAL